MGDSVQTKRAFAEFWESVEFPMVLLGSYDDAAPSTRRSFLNVLSPPEQLPFQENIRIIFWIGPDATMDRRGSIDFTKKVYNYFPTDLIPRTNFASAKWNDEFIIAISEFCSSIFFLLLRDKAVSNKLVDYTGASTHVVSWLTHRKSGHEWGRLLLRILDRCEQSRIFRTYPLFISTFNNVECDNLTRLSENSTGDFAKSRNWHIAGPSKLFQFYNSDAFFRRITIAPSDSERRLSFTHQLAEKITFMSIPRNPSLNPLYRIVGKGGDGITSSKNHPMYPRPTSPGIREIPLV